MDGAIWTKCQVCILYRDQRMAADRMCVLATPLAPNALTLSVNYVFDPQKSAGVGCIYSKSEDQHVLRVGLSGLNGRSSRMEAAMQDMGCCRRRPAQVHL